MFEISLEHTEYIAKPRTLIFDLSEVLIAGILGVEKPLAITLGISEQQVLAILSSSPLEQLFLADLSEEDYLALLIKRNDWALSIEFLKRILRENFGRVIPGMPQLLEELSLEYELVLLSDHAREWIAFIESIHPFLQYFQHRFYSFQIHQTKQHPGTFKIVLNCINKEASQCLFIDDSEANIRAATETGIPCVRFTNMLNLKMVMAKRHLIKEATYDSSYH